MIQKSWLECYNIVKKAAIYPNIWLRNRCSRVLEVGEVYWWPVANNLLVVPFVKFFRDVKLITTKR